MTALQDLAEAWRAEGRTLRERYGLEELARLSETHAAELTHVLAETRAEALTLSEAAAESGYSERRLRELVAEGNLENVGRKHAPRVRRGDLPRKPRPAASGFDPDAEAALIVLRAS